jgi:hypothetical protein
MPINNIIEFIVYVIPGFLSIEVYRAAYPIKQKSEFSQIVWSILFGVLIVIIIKWSDINILHNQLFSDYSGIPGIRYSLALLFGGLFLGLFRIGLHNLRYYLSRKCKKLERIAPDPQTIWATINNKTNKDWSVVYLNDGSIYLGYISKYTFDPDKDNQDFLLSKAKRVDDQLKEIYTITGIGVYLNTRDVKRIEFLEGKK